MSDFHFVFTSYLWFSDEEGNFVGEQKYPTKDIDVNKEVMNF